MGYFSCNAESAIATCDPHNWDLSKNRRKPKTQKYKTNNNNNSNNRKIREFYYNELVAATNGFSAEFFLGKGSHGSVYKAVLDDGKLIAAVKKTKLHNSSTTTNRRLQNQQSSNCTNCNNCTSPAENEIEILSRVQHPRLVNLLGFSSDSLNDNRLIVVEYMPNGSLYEILHSSSTSRPPGWTRRVRFAVQIAKAVQVLHSANPPVIHRDIKSSNVLIDEKGNARLGDFGLALRGHVEDVRVKCTPPAGTLGYLDPNYLAPSDLSSKSDVFSFGILLLEIISGRHAIDVNYSPPSVVDWAVPLIKRGDFAGICDVRVGSPPNPVVIKNMAVLAARCVRSTAEKRPAMSEVVECLKLVAKKAHAPPIWNNLKRRVGRVEESQPLMRWEAYDRSEEVDNVNVNANTKLGSRRNRKVSSVPSAEYGNEGIYEGILLRRRHVAQNRHMLSLQRAQYAEVLDPIFTMNETIGDRMVRSRSVGHFSEIKVGSDSNVGPTRSLLARRKPGVAVKMPTVRLSKSRSMGVLHSPRLVHYHNKGYVVEFEGKSNSTTGFDMSKMVISLDEKSEKEMFEKPLVSI
ncbi:serine/threonine-protein kinase-like protein At1g28390 [Quercus suber]|uniref:Serine/threonine-protein kinase-like protein n=1 Tax=Quercus suber TaxID=58331 RepID=A0AAW0KZI1_QUESU|nr:serine/threonine-protein kinase-like protein At1g28390 [Quercus suber]POE50192.1 serine/threonine-protein kinase-like protein [Quercus suber]